VLIIDFNEFYYNNHITSIKINKN